MHRSARGRLVIVDAVHAARRRRRSLAGRRTAAKLLRDEGAVVVDKSSNKISGRVVLKESGAGIPDLLVVIHDVDPGTRPEELIDAPEDGDRIGSVLTAADGRF